MQIKKSGLGPDFFAWNVFLRLKSLYLLKKEDASCNREKFSELLDESSHSIW